MLTSGSVLMAAVTITAFTAGVTSVYAQSNVQGNIFGTIAGAASGSTITVENTGTGLKRSTTPDSSGSYIIPGLPTGTYTVTLKAPGLAEQTQGSVGVKAGTGTAVNFAQTADQTLKLEKYVVSGSAISPIDVSSVESVTILQMQQVEQIPVERNTTAVALLAPGTSQGIAAFGTLASFGGSSVAENAYYVNGFNLTNFRNGLGGGSVPFEFYDQFVVKTGGYSAEFGRSTGGVIDATTKSGSNTFHAGANVYFEPSALAARAPSSIGSNGALFIDTSRDYNQSYNANVYVSGAIIQNKLFYYGLYNARDTKHEDAGSISTYYTSNSKDPFWGGKLDWNITDTQTLAITGISDKRRIDTNTSDYNDATGQIGASHGLTYSDRGGHDFIANYSGQFTPDFTVTALYGQGTAAASDYNGVPYVVDSRVPPSKVISGSSTFLSSLEDKRKSYRVDLTYRFSLMGAHTLRIGYDREDTSSDTVTSYPGGGIYYRYYPATGGVTRVNGVTVPVGATQYVREQIYGNNGHFSTISKAYYIEDNWKLMDERLLLSLGLRNDEFNNMNKVGQSFVDLKNQWAPRLGATFDINKDDRSKLFATYGRYTMPIANNTNIRFSGGEIYTQDYYVLNSVDATTHLPTVGAQLGAHYVLPGEDGALKDPKTIVNQDLKPMYQDEVIVGYQTAVNKDWTAGVRGTYREMTHFIEDIGADVVPGDDSTYVDVLTNPGHTLNIWADLGDGKGLRQFIVPANQQGYGGQIAPPAVRKYIAAEFFFEKSNNGKWWLQGSYTLSHSWGNDEGYVLSDIAQTDAGLTELYDYPQLMDGRWGNLANDRRHKIKLFGAVKLNSEWQMGFNALVQSGTPKLAIGYYPGNDANLQAYGAAYFYNNGKLVPRGSLGNTPVTKQLDVSFKYTPAWGRQKISFGADIFNVFNFKTVTEYYQYAENGGSGTPNPFFGTPTVYQTPIYVRLSAAYKF